MATRFIPKALAAAALGIALSLALPAPTTASPASSNTTGSLQLDPPAAPSNCKARTSRFRDGKGHTWIIPYASWTDNSSNEDGFTVEEWRRNQSGEWALAGSFGTAANSTVVGVDGSGPNYKVRVKAFNAAGESAWSNWGH